MSYSQKLKCLNCNAPIKFNPHLQKCECDYCNSTFSVKEFKDNNASDVGLSRCEKRYIQKSDKLLEKVLVIMGFIDNVALYEKIKKLLAGYEIEEDTIDAGKYKKAKGRALNDVIDQEEELQILAMFKGFILKNGDIAFSIVDDNGEVKRINGIFRTYKALVEVVGDMSLIEVKHLYHKKVELSSEYFSVMSLLYLFNEGKISEINFLNTKESLRDDSVQKAYNSQILSTIYRCNSCGAELLADDSASCAFCVYCHNQKIIKERFSGKYNPHLVVPFKLTQEDAIDIYKKWIRKSLFIPKHFKEKETFSKITGIYIPAWLIDCKAIGRISGRAEKDYKVITKENGFHVRQYYSVGKLGSVSYEKVPVVGSNQLDQETLGQLEPYDYSMLKEFSLPYVAGYLSQIYDVDGEKAEAAFEKRVDCELGNRLEIDDDDFGRFKINKSSYALFDIERHYTLLPVFVLAVQYQEKTYQFLVNGQTGKLLGVAPKSRWLQLRFCGYVFLIVVILQIIGGVLFG